MNRSKIEWCDYTWNPVTGCLGPNNDGAHCSYCYAKRIAERFRGGKAFPNGFEPTWHPERLDEPAKVKAPSRIFVGSMTDMGAPWIKPEWKGAILKTVAACPQHTFLFLTKQPEQTRWDAANIWPGVTVTSISDIARLRRFPRLDASPTWFISFEPLLGRVYHMGGKGLSGCWIIIGAQTGPGAIMPQRSWIAEIVDRADAFGIPVFMKNNLRPYWDGEWRQEWPK